MLWKIIKKIREKHKLSQAEFGKRLDVTATYVSFLEKEYSKEHKHMPTDELIRKIAKEFSISQGERKEIEETLLYEKARLIIAPEITKDYLLEVKKNKILIGDKEGKGNMPSAFIVKLKKDISKNPNFSKITEIPKSTIDVVLKGEKIITREQVIKFATELGQPIEQYLILSGYMPYEFVDVMTHNGMISMFRSLTKLKPEEIEKMVEAINNIINIYTKK